MSRLSRNLSGAAIVMAVGLLGASISASLSPATAGSAKCPVWTAVIIDSFAADGFLLSSRFEASPPVVTEPPLDDPTIPKMSCKLLNEESQGYFRLVLGHILPWNSSPNQVTLEVGDNYGSVTKYLHQSWPEGDVGAAHACRAEVLQSFIWNQFCAPELP